MRAVFIADLHLDGMGSALGPEANRLILDEVERVENWAVRNGVRHVFYLGDVCDKHYMSYEAHTLLMGTWSKHADYLERHVIVGNHDFAETGVYSLSVLQKAIDNGMFEGSVRIYTEPAKLKIEGVKFQLLPYPYEKADPGAHIVLGHFAVTGSLRDNGSKIKGGTEVVSGPTYIMGHLHKPHDVGKVHYTGTLFQRDFGASLPKFFTTIEARMDAGELQLDIDRIPHQPAFTLTNLVVAAHSDLKKVTSNLLDKFKLLIASSVKVPPDFLLTHPNVVRQDSYRNNKELGVLTQTKDLQDVGEGLHLDDPFSGLPDYLESLEVDTEIAARAIEIVETIRNELEA